MRFRFRLARVQRFVELKEREKKMEVAVVFRDLETLSAKRRSIELEIRKLLTDGSSPLKMDVNFLRFGAERISMNGTELKKIDNDIAKNKEILEIKQSELGRLGMRKKAIESLHDKRKKEFTAEENRRAQTRLDEAYRMSKLGK